MKFNRVLVTGANVGLGFEAARQLANKGIPHVVLGCRSQKKADTAKGQLEELTGKGNVFETLIMDVSSLPSVRQAVKNFNGSFDGLILNAGGAGGANVASKTEDGVPVIVAANVLGHVLLVDLLLEEGKLNEEGGSVVYSGSEAARGVPLFNMKKPRLKSGSVSEMTAITDGSYYAKKDQTMEGMYGLTKLLGTLWMSSMAHRYPSMRFVTMSPGGSTGTTFARDMPKHKQAMFKTVMPVMKFMGQMHSVRVGAKRYVDALLDDKTYESGVFYASKKGTSGKVVDQVRHLELLRNSDYQENANEAIHHFIQVEASA